VQELERARSNHAQELLITRLLLYQQRIGRIEVEFSRLRLGATFRLLSPNVYYQSDVYTLGVPSYYAIVVWQFWGRAAEAS
jgi:hypothetical protein